MNEQWLDLLEFKREEMSQLLLVGTLLAAIAMSGLLFLLAERGRGRLRSTLLVAQAGATLLFLFGTILDALILPGMHRAATVMIPEQVPGFVGLTRLVVYSLLAGVLVLVGSIGALGFLSSRRVGIATATAAGLFVATFVACAIVLDGVMRAG
ncbi:MAG: hypothetical protein IPJ41_17705 [Phycisphaerales bacterium]|nr:hypothetical protein [Phycisphaerales bacterium]